MKNLKKLGLILSVGTVAAFAVGGCSSDPAPPGPTAGSNTGGSSAGSTGTSGSPATGGSSAGMAGMPGTAGSSAGTTSGGGGAGGASGGSGGSAAGSGGKAGGGGTGGSGGASGGASGGGGGPSADCTAWCSGAKGLITICAGKLADAVNTEPKCLAECNNDAAKGVMGLACWKNHLENITVRNMDATVHCPHASGAPANGQCNETK